MGKTSVGYQDRIELIETPPRAWGRRQGDSLHRMGCGNTPTSVGKTSILESPPVNALETPPRAWGRPDSLTYGQRSLGNTPTSVGKTSEDRLLRMSFQKHPHERGEDDMEQLRGVEVQKHPHERGEDRPVASVSHTDTGNTPTSVGKTVIVST